MSEQVADQPAALEMDEMDVFKEKCQIIPVFGRAAAGKWSLGRYLVNDSSFDELKIYHLSVGDFVREEQAAESIPISYVNHRALQTVVNGVTIIALIEEKLLQKYKDGARLFILDGFPRNGEQYHHFNSKYGGNIPFAFFVDTPPDVARTGQDDLETDNSSLVDQFSPLDVITVENTGKGTGESLYLRFKNILLEHDRGGALLLQGPR